MITQIDISNFGSFQNFLWKSSVCDSSGKTQSFKKLNIIYGRNYSGKTTLSRIFRTLQEKKLPLNFENPDFNIFLDSGNVTHSQITNSNLEIRVYNKDFISENLSFLHDQHAGEIRTFAIVGTENINLSSEIENIESELGDILSKSGLRYDKIIKRSKAQSKLKEKEDANNELDKKLRDYASEKIKKNSIYQSVNYNIASIKTDIATIREKSITTLTPDVVISKQNLLKDEALPIIEKTIDFSPNIENIKKTAFSLLQKKIAPTSPVQELLNDKILQTWVKTGMPYHREKRDTCAFCQQTLPSDIWKILDAHFSQESIDLEMAIDSCLASIKVETDILSQVMTIKSSQFYFNERSIFDSIRIEFDENLKIYKNDLQAIHDALLERKISLFSLVACPSLSNNIEEFKNQVKKINNVIAENNKKTETLSQDKIRARNELRIDSIVNFIELINLSSEEEKIRNFEKEFNFLEIENKEAEVKIKGLEKSIETLRAKQKDERKGAERVNELLSHFFGHDGIRLVAVEDKNSTAVKFQVMREKKAAFHLSDGECSLVAFCYFIAKLEEVDSKGKALTIYIDDPISSLDSNHIFFLYSLIESMIARPIKNPDGTNSYKYEQLFISTHNLDFLKYLKKLPYPEKKSKDWKASFLIERNGTHSKISSMPDYLQNYITEFNYLFHQIFKCSDPNLAKEDFGPFYAFGNNMRKFLEAYLFYKYPCDQVDRLRKFLDGDEISFSLINRLDNEFSHLECAFDRSMRPIEVPEISKIANCVLDKLFQADKEQFNSLLKSIGEPERSI